LCVDWQRPPLLEHPSLRPTIATVGVTAALYQPAQTQTGTRDTADERNVGQSRNALLFLATPPAAAAGWLGAEAACSSEPRWQRKEGAARTYTTGGTDRTRTRSHDEKISMSEHNLDCLAPAAAAATTTTTMLVVTAPPPVGAVAARRAVGVVPRPQAEKTSVSPRERPDGCVGKELTCIISV